MKQSRNRLNPLKSVISKPKKSDRESELQAINRILDRRYEVLVELG